MGSSPIGAARERCFLKKTSLKFRFFAKFNSNIVQMHINAINSPIIAVTITKMQSFSEAFSSKAALVLQDTLEQAFDVELSPVLTRQVLEVFRDQHQLSFFVHLASQLLDQDLHAGGVDMEWQLSRNVDFQTLQRQPLRLLATVIPLLTTPGTAPKIACSRSCTAL